MNKSSASPYRWGILLAIVPIIIATEMMWLSLAPVASQAEEFFGVTSFSISIFAMSYMIMFILFSIPASWVVDRFGYRYSLIIGALITAIFGVCRYIFIDNYSIVLFSQFMLAVGQPFLLNISTKVPANWFPLKERSTAAGILIMAQYIGFALPMLLAPAIAEREGIKGIFYVFAIVGVAAALVAIIFSREKPKDTSFIEEVPKEDISFRSIKELFKNIEYVKVMFICFISIGIFNTLLTLIEFILIPRGITSVEAGIVGAVFVVAGIIGAVVLPIISDALGKRTIMVTVAVIILIPLYGAIGFINSFTWICVAAAAGGFTVMGVAPILFQHGSEVAYPIQEGTSLGVILMMGQISGALFVWIFNVVSEGLGDITLPMVGLILASAIQIPVALKMRESSINMEKNIMR